MTRGPAGERLLDAVAVMDRLRSPGGCPWDAEQTHASLLRYLIEECYELVQAVEDGDAAAIREELGDVLLQVLFHARIAAERPATDGGFTIDDVASSLVDKLVRRHPHVFAGVSSAPKGADAPTGAADQQRRWDELKRAERAAAGGRVHVLDGVAMAQPALALAAKLGSRAGQFGDTTALPAGDGVAEQIFRLGYSAGAQGQDIEAAVRAVARQHAGRMAAGTDGRPDGGADPVSG